MSRTCRSCGEGLPEEASARRKYCSDTCRVNFNRSYKGALSKAGSKKEMEEHIKQMKDLAFDRMNDEVREVLRSEIRNQITQHVRDNVLGAAEVITQMLPKALAGVAKDLESKDWVTRSRAQALVMKYAMEFKDTDGDDDTGRTLTVVHRVPGFATPDTPLGERVADDIIEGEVVEEFETGWPTCKYCKERKHPDAMRTWSEGAGRGSVHVCRSCAMRREITKGRVDPAGDLDD